MEGYDSMDNNSNNNVSGIPNVSDIKFDDTPAESFENLYGGSGQQPVSNVSMVEGPSMTPNPEMVPNMVQGPSMAPNPEMVPNMVQGPSMAPNPEMAPNMVEGPSMTPNPEMAPNMVQGPSMAPNPEMAPNMVEGLSMTPNPETVVQQPVEDLSDIDIDDEKMQSIEEQLSKTSQYNPADFQQEQIKIPTDDQYEKNKSSYAFLIALFVILGLAILITPQIIKFIK